MNKPEYSSTILFIYFICDKKLEIFHNKYFEGSSYDRLNASDKPTNRRKERQRSLAP